MMQKQLSHRLILITGPSGAGRSTAIRALEDLDVEAIDNMPLSLLPALLQREPTGRPVALGFDARNSEFSAIAMIELIDNLSRRPDVSAELLYLDCRADILLNRFSETRRRHPLAPAESPDQGIARELDLLQPIRVRADVLIDTSELTPHDLRAEVGQWFLPSETKTLAVTVNSFSYKRGVPRGLDMVFDVRFLRNPYWEERLRAGDGRDPAVAQYITADTRFEPFFDKVLDLVTLLLPAYSEEGKSHLSIGFGCTGGQHRSVLSCEQLGNALAERGWQVSKRHRELERRGLSAPIVATG
ncbi:MAG: RNase adapter RapZ [Brevirhabdus sp.]